MRYCFLFFLLFATSIGFDIRAMLSGNSLSDDIKGNLWNHGLYGEKLGLVVNAEPSRRGLVQFDLSAWINGSTFDSFARSLAIDKMAPLYKDDHAHLEKIHRDVYVFYRRQFAERVHNYILQFADEYPVDESRDRRFAVFWHMVAGAALEKLGEITIKSLFAKFIGTDDMNFKKLSERMDQFEYYQQHLKADMFRDKLTEIFEDASDELFQIFKDSFDQLLYHHRMNERLFTDAFSTVLEQLHDDFNSSIYKQWKGRAMHFVQARVIEINVKKLSVTVEILFPMLYNKDISNFVRVTAVGQFDKDRSHFLEVDLSGQYKLEGSRIKDWKHVEGPCQSAENLNVCHGIVDQEKDCSLEADDKPVVCPFTAKEVTSNYANIRPVTEGYLIATTLSHATMLYGNKSSSLQPIEDSVFYLSLPQNVSFVIGGHKLNSRYAMIDFQVLFSNKSESFVDVMNPGRHSEQAEKVKTLERNFAIQRNIFIIATVIILIISLVLSICMCRLFGLSRVSGN